MNPVYIIAEVGVNHNGNINNALELVDRAKEVGANCVKFQTFKADQIVTKDSPKAAYQLEVTDKNESQFQMLKKLELSFNDYETIIKKCNDVEIDFLSTPYNKEDAIFLNNLGVNSFKIASGQLTEIPFLQFVSRLNKKMIISTGMGTLSDVFNAVQAIRETGNDKIVVLQCTTNYPSSFDDANLLAMKSIKDACHVSVGYSDHVESNLVCFASVALGAEIVEKHFTLDKNMEGPDHSSSLNPFEFAELVSGIRNIELALGNGIKIPSEAEKRNSFGMKRSLVVLEELKKGTILQEKHIGFKRPFDGLSPNYLNQILGKRLSKDMKKDESIQLTSIEW